MPIYKGKQVDIRPPTQDDEGYDATKRQVVVKYLDGNEELIDAAELEASEDQGSPAA